MRTPQLGLYFTPLKLFVKLVYCTRAQFKESGMAPYVFLLPTKTLKYLQYLRQCQNLLFRE